MRLDFRHEFKLPIDEVYAYFQTPAGWTRVFGFSGKAVALGDDWFAVPLKGFPFPLVAKNVEQIPEKFVRWVFKGFWRGYGEVHFTEKSGHIIVEGHEEVSIN